MTGNIRLIWKKIEQLKRMAEYLAYSTEQVRQFIPISNWAQLTPEQHESLAAFRTRFSELQEHLGKTMRAIAIEEEVVVTPFGAVLAYMEKLAILDSTEHWKLIRELRNSVSHEYEEDEKQLSQLFAALLAETETLTGYLQRIIDFFDKTYAS